MNIPLITGGALMLALFKTLTSLGLVMGASLSNGKLARKFKLPIISGFLITGVLAGPSALGIMCQAEVTALQPLDHLALGMIAITAGSELYFKELGERWRSIIAVMIGLVTVTLTIGAGATFLLRSHIPFMSGLDVWSAVAVSLLIGTIMIARSPSAAIAIIKELGARGPFTQLILGVTVLMDVAVIIIFALSLSVSHGLIDGEVHLSALAIEVALELCVSIMLGAALAWVAHRALHRAPGSWLRPITLLSSAGLAVWLAEVAHHQHWSFAGAALKVEPLLVCLTIGVVANNFSSKREELDIELHKLSPMVYLTFFTMTGASLKLELLTQVWQAALLLFAIRLAGIGLGAAVGGALAGEPSSQHRYRWMGFVTQAGVGLGLAQRVSGEFTGWGESFAALMIAVIVINELIGPLFFKRAITRSGESGGAIVEASLEDIDVSNADIPDAGISSADAEQTTL